MKKYLLVFLIVILISSNLVALRILEPINKDITYFEKIDLGYFSANEFFMISFLLENDEDYDVIRVAEDQNNDVIIENTKKTPESIYTIIKLNDNLNGNYSLKLILESETRKKEITLNMFITEEVIHTILENYNQENTYEKIENIDLKIINKSNTTKKIKITSDIPDTWFKLKKEKLDKDKIITLQPNSTTKVSYQYFPKEIGLKNINIKINNINEIEEKEYINYYLEVETKKDIKSLYGSKEHTFPLFNFNMIPIYFFNKIIKII